MLQNYFLSALRNLRKHFSYSLINITGLGLGLATSLLLFTWIRHELSYDRFHEKADRIYRGALEYSFGGQVARTAVSPTALLPTMQKNFAEVETGVRIFNPSGRNPYIVRRDEKMFQENKFYFADSTFFKVFSFKLITGNPDKVLTEPQSVVLTRSMATKYFGDEDPIGKSLMVNNRAEYKVTGLVEDVPSNSMIQFEFLASFSSRDDAKEVIWWSANFQTFVVLAPNTAIGPLSEKTNELVKKELAAELTGKGDYVVYNFDPLTDIYLRSEVDEPEITGSIQFIYVFSAIALLVLVIACINYVNLATARAADRAKEVGVRKVVGALRKQLFFQFISESMMITFLGFCFAFMLSMLSLPLFNSLTGKTFSPGALVEPAFLGMCLLAMIVIALAAGAYPAFAITSFKPVTVLKGNFRSSGRGVWLRKFLVIFQFGTSAMLIVGTLVIIKQLDFIQSRDLGYEKENILVLPLDRKIRENFDQLKTELLRSGKVTSVARATDAPTKIMGGYGVKLESGSDTDRGMIVTAMSVDKDFIPTLGMTLTTGRNFTDADFAQWRADTTSAFVLNERALKELGIREEKAVGTRLNMSNRKGEIVGVVKDFHFSSLHEPINPLVIFIEDWNLDKILVRINPGNIQDALAEMKSIYGTVVPHRPFEFEFLDQKYEQMYNKEQRMGVLCTVFATLAIIIACLGLLGLVAFAAAQKTKEIGIRKVLGATAGSIMLLITGDYVKLVVVAIVLGLPIAYWFMSEWWLRGFVYRTDIGIFPLAAAAGACVVIALGAASYQAIKAASIDPATTLRSE